MKTLLIVMALAGVAMGQATKPATTQATSKPIIFPEERVKLAQEAVTSAMTRARARLGEKSPVENDPEVKAAKEELIAAKAALLAVENESRGDTLAQQQADEEFARIAGKRIDMSRLKVGDIGSIEAVKVVEIISDTESLCESASGSSIILNGVSTVGVADDKWINPKGVMEVTGTRSFITVLGAKRTVYEIKPLKRKK